VCVVERPAMTRYNGQTGNRDRSRDEDDRGKLKRT
jgi:hypothetical protein